MKSKISRLILLGGALALPAVTFAQDLNADKRIGGAFFSILDFVEEVLSQLFPLITIALVVLFAYQLIMFMKSKGEDIENAATLRKRVINSFIVLLVWFTLFGLINAVAKSFGLKTDGTLQKSTMPQISL